MSVFAVFLALLAVPLAAQGQEAPPPPVEVLTLDHATRLALEGNRLIKVAALEVRKAEDEVAVVRTRRLPVFDVNLIESQLLTRPSFDFPRGAFGIFSPIGPVPPADTKIYSPRKPVTVVLARAIQPLSQLYKVGLGVALQELNLQIAREKLRALQRSISNNVKQVYYGVLQAQSAMEAMEQAMQLFKELDRITGQYLAQQVVLKSDSLEAKARLARAEYDSLALRNSLAAAKEQLNEIMGRDITAEFRVTQTPGPEALAQDIASLRSRALEQRTEIKEARLKAKQAEYDFRLKKSEYLPEVSLAFHYLSLANVEVLPRNAASIGLVFSWDPFDWGRRKRELAEKSKIIEQANHGVREAEAQVLLDASKRFRKLQETQALLYASQLGEEVAREKLRVAMERYKQEAALVREVLQAQATLAEAGNQYRQALLSYWTAKADLEKALGED